MSRMGQARINRIKATSRLKHRLRDAQKDLPLLKCKHCGRTLQRDPLPTEARLPWHYNDQKACDFACPGSFSDSAFEEVPAAGDCC